MRAATIAIQKVFAAGFLPSALEIADSFTLAAVRKRTGSANFNGCDAHLILELDGQAESVHGEIRVLKRILERTKPLFIQQALGAAACERIWQLRREFSYSLRDTGLKKLNQDIVVPRGRLEELFALAASLQHKHNLPVACFGHAGDGNIHVNIMVDEADPSAGHRSQALLDQLFNGVIALGGVITGEHGIGLAKKQWWPLAASRNVRELHRAIKAALDPRGILNPGKFVSVLSTETMQMENTD
jgi:FAD/FMN-containing dehydrogenase